MIEEKDNEDREVIVNHKEDVLTEDLILEGIYRYTNFKKFGFSFDFPYVRDEQPSGDISYPRRQYEEMKNHLLTNEQYEEIIEEMKSANAEYRTYLKWFEKNLAVVAKDTNLIREFFDKSLKVTGTIVRFYVDRGINEELNRQGIPIHTVRSSETDTTRAANKLKEIAERYKGELERDEVSEKPVKISSELEKELVQFCEKYGYLGMKYFTGAPWTVWQAYNMLLVSEGEKSVIDESKSEDKVEYVSPLQKYAEELLLLRTEKWEVMCYGCYLFRKMILEYFADKIYYPDFIYLRMEEAIGVLDGKYLGQDIVVEREHHVLDITDDGVKLSVGGDVPASGRDVKEVKRVSQIKGVIANSGKARGVVKVIMTPRECGKVKEGDVLVATMSTPDFLPGMMKAAAFVTDIGGMTSHAAIVSREMKKPCIIGTKIATQVLKDGDEVEVDADEGVVRILKKAK